MYELQELTVVEVNLGLSDDVRAVDVGHRDFELLGGKKKDNYKKCYLTIPNPQIKTKLTNS